MPLSDGPAWVCQHVGPVPKLSALRFASHPDLPDGVVLTDLIVVKHRDHSLYFLRKNRYCAQRLKEHKKVKSCVESCKAYLHLVLWDLKAEGLVVVRVQCVLLHCRLLLLQSLAVLQKMNLHIRICRGLPVPVVMQLCMFHLASYVMYVVYIYA